jgi:two-component system, NtrC family, response regulator AtoC
MGDLSEDKTRSHTFDLAPPDRPRAVIFWDGGTESRNLVPGQELVIGRGEECDVQILHKSVSRRHARLRAGPPLVLEDLGSSNGTRIDGAIIPAGSHPLAPGQVAEIGAALLVVQGDLGAAAARPPSATHADFDRFLTLIAKSPLSVLIVGETGAGKEITAEALHRQSPRASGPLVRLNCAAFPQTLLEGELFGYEKGAFTGAVHAKPGLIESAHGGTLFLDEVGEMPASTQAALLRVLESGEVRRLGAIHPVAVDVRLLSATNRDLDVLQGAGTFRRDLYYRLAGVTVRVAPLRARRDRILPLAKGFALEAARRAGIEPPAFTAAAIRRLIRHPWRGNVRELRNVIERASALAEGKAIEPDHLLLDDSPGGEPEPDERQRVVDALEAADGNQTRAAEILGVSRRTLINRIEEYALPRPRKRGT